MSGHASLPEGTVNAIGVLADFLVRLSACSSEEQQWFAFVADLAQSNDGSAVGIASADKDFGSLTSVVGTMKKMGDAYILTDDIRFPTSISGTELQEAF